MAKRKKISTPDHDMKVTGVVVGLCVAAVIAFFVFSKGKEQKEAKVVSASRKVVEVSLPPENVKPVEDRGDARPSTCPRTSGECPWFRGQDRFYHR